MLREFASKYRQRVVLAVASVAIAAYVIPFNWGSVGQTQAQPSLYDRLHDRVNKIQEDVDETLDGLRDRFGGSQRAQDRIDDAQEKADERFNNARDRINDATGSDNNNNKLESNSVEEEDDEENIQSLRTEGNANNVNNRAETNIETDDIDGDSSEKDNGSN